MAYERRTTEQGDPRISEDGLFRVTESSVPPEDTYKRRITEQGDVRVSENGLTRVTEDSVPSENSSSSDLSARVFIAGKSLLGATVTIPAPATGSSLNASATVTKGPVYSEVGASVFVTDVANSDSVPLRGKIVIPAYVSTEHPTFVFGNSSDSDYDTLTYELQLAIDGDWGGTGSFTETGIPADEGEYTSHTITNALDPDTLYTWRVRSYDGYEYSEWSDRLAVIYAVDTPILRDIDGKVCVIRSGTEDVGATVEVEIYDDEDLGATIAIPRNEDLGATVGVLPYSDIGGKVTVLVNCSDLNATVSIQPGKDLKATVTVGRFLFAKVNIPPYNDIKASVYIEKGAFLPATVWIFVKKDEDLGATVFVPGRSSLGATVDVRGWVHAPLGGKITLTRISSLGATVKVTNYLYKNILARVFIEGTKDLGAQIYIPPHKDLAATVRIITVLGATVTVPARSHLMATVTVDVDYQRLYVTVNVIRSGNSDIGGYVSVGKVTTDLPAIVTVDAEYQKIYGQVTVIASGYQPLGASVGIDWTLQRLSGRVTVLSEGFVDFGGRVSISSDWQHLHGIVLVSVPGHVSVGASADVECNRPSGVYPSGYVVPSGYPPLPSGWTSGDDAIPGPEAVAIPTGEWQGQTEILFIWAPPSDWGYLASKAGYLIAWNDDPGHTVTESDQYIDTNSIQKNWYDSGSMWFHIRARNSYGWLGPQNSINIMINQKPTVPPEPFYVDFEENLTGGTHSSRPTLYWGKSTDDDQLDVIKYQLAVMPSGHPEQTVTYSDIPQAISGPVNSLKIDFDMTEGNYQWRVRATDSKQYGDWSELKPLVVSTAGEDIGASVKLVEYWLANVLAKVLVIPYRNLGAKLTIYGRSHLGAKVTITAFSDLGASVEIPPGKQIQAKVCVERDGTRDLSARVAITHVSNLGARVELKPYSNINASVNITWEHQRIGGTVNVCRYSVASLGASVRVSGTIKGRVTVVISGTSDLGAKARVQIYNNSNGVGATVNILPYSDVKATVTVPARRFIQARVSVLCDRPDDVAVTCDIPDSIWQEGNNPHFEWDEPEDDFFEIAGYYISWNDDPDYEVSAADQYVTSNSLSKYMFDAGIMYLHIKAVNSIGNTSLNTTHYGIFYNHKPGMVGLPLMVEGYESPAIGTVTPEFSWGNAEDADQLDTVRYNIMIATDAGFENIIYSKNDIPSTGNSSRTSFQLPLSGKLPGEGTYYWTVRAWDGKEYGEWVTYVAFEVVSVKTDISATVKIPIRDFVNVSARVNIVGRSEIKARVVLTATVSCDIGATVRVSYYSAYEIKARVSIPARRDISAKLTIIRYKNLYGKVNVYAVPGNRTLSSKVNVCRASDWGLKASARIVHGGGKNIGAFVRIPGRSSISATANIYDSEHFGHIEDFSRNISARVYLFNSATRGLSGKVSVIADKPGTPIISANVPAGIWQNENEIHFTWTPVTAHFVGIAGYYVQIDHSPSSQASESFQKIDDFYKYYDLEKIDGAGAYYFHVAAKAENNKFGDTAHYAVLYNTVPTAPTTPMTANGAPCTSSPKTVTSGMDVLFAWGQSYDSDPLDIITYRLQIATREDFGLDSGGNSSILYDHSGIPTYSHTMTGGSISAYGKLYWRVRAYDGHQYSENWSPTGRLTVNTPPQPPTNLTVYG